MRNQKFIIFILAVISLMITNNGYAQVKHGTNPMMIDSSAIFELESTTKGLLIPRMSTAQINAIAGPSNALMVYDTTVRCVKYYNKPISTWECLSNVKLSQINDSILVVVNRAINTGVGITGKNLTNANGVIITGGTGAVLKDVSLRIDSTAVAKMVNQSPVKDSIIKAISSSVTSSPLKDSLALIEPWYNVATNKGATANTQDIYQMGNVGIGISTPTTKLHVYGLNAGGEVSEIIQNNTNAAGSSTILQLNDLAGDLVKLMGDNSGSIASLRATNRNNALAFWTGNAGGSERMRITSTGRVAINTTVPTDTLDINGTTRVRILNSGAASDSIVTADVNGVLRKRTVSNILGVATTNILTLTGDTMTSIVNGVVSNKIGVNSNDWHIAGNASTNGNTNFLGTTDLQNLSFRTNNLQRMRIDTNGNVGIGTTAPVSRTSIQTVATTGNAIALNLNNPTAYGVGTGANGVAIRFNHTPNDAGSTGVIADIVGVSEAESTSTVGALAFRTRSGAVEATAEHMRITSAGLVGIGTAAPTNKLHIIATSNPLRLEGLQSGLISDSILTTDATGVVRRINSSLLGAGVEPWYNQSTLSGATSNTQNIYQMGNVGIQTTTSSTSLQLGNNTANANNYIVLGERKESPESNLPYIGQTSVLGSDNSLGLGAHSTTGAIVFYTGNAGFFDSTKQRMLIDASGKVGIGTSSPTNRLHVSSMNPLRLDSVQYGATTDSIMTINSTGVIRKMSAGDIAGKDWHITGNSDILDNATYYLGTSNNIPLNFRVNGQKAGRIASSGDVFFGYQAGNATTGSTNTGIGHQALVVNTSGSGNTALGYVSLQANTVGTFNTAIGRSSMIANDSGNSNTAIGMQTLIANTKGSYNFAGGNNTLSSNTTGDFNVGLGYGALLANTTGQRNIGIGTSAISAGTNGFANIAVGFNAGYSNNGGTNTAIGFNSLYFNNIGSNNNVLGSSAYFKNKIGSNNNALGGNAGYNDSLGSNNTMLGHYADVPSSAINISFATAIGSNAVVSQSNSVILGRVSDFTGIGNTAPTNKLHVTASINPVRLEGVQYGATTDSILSINATGVVRKLSTTDIVKEPWYSQATGTGATLNTQNIYQMANVGIGTTAPAAKLEVNGGSGTTGVSGLQVSGSDITGSALPVVINTNTSTQTYGTNTYGRMIRLRDLTTGTPFYDMGVDDSLSFFIASNGDYGNSSIVIKKSNNYVGINQKTPTNELHVSSTSNPLRLEGLQPGTASDSIMTVNSTGVVRKRTVSSVSTVQSIATKTASYTLTTDDYTIFFNCTSGSLTATLPSAAANTGKIFVIRKIDATVNTLVFSPAIRADLATTIASVNYPVAFTVQSDGTSWYIIGKY
jgi:hypothetical protein